jgi:hypothetical protein
VSLPVLHHAYKYCCSTHALSPQRHPVVAPPLCGAGTCGVSPLSCVRRASKQTWLHAGDLPRPAYLRPATACSPCHVFNPSPLPPPLPHHHTDTTVVLTQSSINATLLPACRAGTCGASPPSCVRRAFRPTWLHAGRPSLTCLPLTSSWQQQTGGT